MWREDKSTRTRKLSSRRWRCESFSVRRWQIQSIKLFHQHHCLSQAFLWSWFIAPRKKPLSPPLLTIWTQYFTLTFFRVHVELFPSYRHLFLFTGMFALRLMLFHLLYNISQLVLDLLLISKQKRDEKREIWWNHWKLPLIIAWKIVP